MIILLQCLFITKTFLLFVFVTITLYYYFLL